MTRTFTVIEGDTKLDQVMHAADLFESHKRLISNPVTFTIDWEDGIIPNIEKTIANLIKIHQLYPGHPHYVVACWCNEDPTGSWWAESVKVVSTGHKWCMFKGLLEHLDFPFKQYYADKARTILSNT